MKKVGIIVVIYEPNIEQLVKILEIVDSSSYSIIVVDNSSSDFCRKKLCSLETVHYCYLKGNRGIATAQNYGIRMCKKLDLDYVAFFDQDSAFDNELLKGLKESYEYLVSKGYRVGFVAPVISAHSKSNLDIRKNKSIVDNDYVQVNIYQSSGMFTSMEVLKDVGFMRDELFIDLVDNDFCWRLKSKGYRLYKDFNSRMYHEPGAEKVRILGFNGFRPSPFRWYFLARNTIYLLTCSYSDKRWLTKSLILMIPKVTFYGFKSNKIIQTYKYFYLGVIDGIGSLIKKSISNRNKVL